MAIADWTWVAPAIGAVTAAAIAGVIAVRISRKNPYERLKTLAEIQEKLKPKQDVDDVIGLAIAEELMTLRDAKTFEGKHPWLMRWQRSAIPVLTLYVVLEIYLVVRGTAEGRLVDYLPLGVLIVLLSCASAGSYIAINLRQFHSRKRNLQASIERAKQSRSRL